MKYAGKGTVTAAYALIWVISTFGIFGKDWKVSQERYPLKPGVSDDAIALYTASSDAKTCI
ncbi:hypothetical protein PFLuk1_01040 [Pseudomonas fluorescens]|nr:hypothetical protein PFLuk1_01040 [Pseudomonas fluorescens]